MPQPSAALFRYRRAQLAALAFAILAFAVAPARAEEFTVGPLYNPSGALYNPTNQAVNRQSERQDYLGRILRLQLRILQTGLERSCETLEG
jgi:hypothetical protein